MSEKANIALTSEKLSEAQKSYESQPEQNSTAGLATLLMQGLS